MRRLTLCVLAALSVGALSFFGAAKPALAGDPPIIYDGDFTNLSDEIVTSPPVYDDAAGWTVGGSDHIAYTYDADSSVETAVFNYDGGDAGSSLSQTFDTDPGQMYRVTYDYGAEELTPSPTSDLERITSYVYDAADSQLGTQNESATLGSNGMGGITTYTYDAYGYDFTADSSTTTIYFYDTGSQVSPNTEGILANVAVYATPESSTAVSFGLPLLTLAALALARRRKPLPGG